MKGNRNGPRERSLPHLPLECFLAELRRVAKVLVPHRTVSITGPHEQGIRACFQQFDLLSRDGKPSPLLREMASEGVDEVLRTPAFREKFREIYPAPLRQPLQDLDRDALEEEFRDVKPSYRAKVMRFFTKLCLHCGIPLHRTVARGHYKLGNATQSPQGPNVRRLLSDESAWVMRIWELLDGMTASLVISGGRQLSNEDLKFLARFPDRRKGAARQQTSSSGKKVAG